MEKQDKNTPQIRFKGYCEALVSREFREFTKLSQGLQIAINKRFVEPGESRVFYITNEFLNPDNKKKFYIENPPRSVIAYEDDILMTRTGNTGKVVTNVFGAYHNNFFKIAYDKTVDKNYLYYLLNEPRIQNEILARAGSSTIPDLNHKDFYSLKNMYPNKKEQTQIGDFFQKIDQVIELQQKALDTARAYKQSMLQKMFPQKGEKVPRVRFAGFSGDWKKLKLGEMFSFSRGEAFGKKDINPDGLFPCIHYGELFTQYNEIIDNPISRTDLQAKKPSEIGDILMPSSDVTPDGLAKASCLNQKDVFLGGDINILRPFKKVSSVFFSYLINYQKSKLLVLVTGSSVKHLYNSDLKSLYYVVPSFEEQTAIGNFFQKLDQQIEQQAQKLATYQQLKKAMLQRMFV